MIKSTVNRAARQTLCWVAVLAVGAFLVLGLGGASVGRVRAADTAGNVRAARLTFVQGSVVAQSAENPVDAPAQMNLPLLAGVRLTTGDDGQAEVEFEDGSVVRITPNSALSLDTLAVEPGSDGGRVFTTGMTLLHGLAYVELRATPEYRYALNAGGDVLSPVENATVRINFDEAPAVFAVLDGAAQVSRQSGANGLAYQREVRAGESLRGDPANQGQYSLAAEIPEDSWDAWNEDRDQVAAAEAGSRTGARDNFAGAQGYGWSDLDADGSWYDVPGQGPVWQPQVAAVDSGFDPYANGSWVYAGGGYLWASAYPWGWTPYRCGNWSFFGGFGWGWSPALGCGGFGWGFWGGVPVNIGLVPVGYHPPRPPLPRPGPIHPPVPGRVVASAAGTATESGFVAGSRRINGITVMPLEPVGSGFVQRGGTAIGASLQRDYPVDVATHAAVLGRPSTQPTAVRTAAGWRAPEARPAPVAPAAPATRSYTGQTRPAPSGSPSTTAPAVRSVPAPAQTQQRQTYTPAPAPVQRIAPPPPPPPPAPAPARPR